MRYRYIIERAPDTAHRNYCVSEITADDETGKVLYYGDYIEDLQTLAQENEPDETLKWREALKSWQPDTILVSQWLDDGIKENRE